MAVTLTGADGLFTRLGKIIDLVKDVGTHQALLATEYDDIRDQYNNNRDYVSAMSDSLESRQLEAGSVINELAEAARKTVIEMVHADDPLPSKTLRAAVDRLIDQMISSSASVDGDIPTLSVTTSAWADGTANTGNGQVVNSVRDTSPTTAKGDYLEYIRPESIELVCTSDTQVTGTAGRETFSVTGELAVSDIRHPDWPGGSGISGAVRVTDPSEDAQRTTGRNILTNSDFEDFTTTDTPDNWAIITGVAGTDIKEEGTTKYRGSKALKFVGDGATKSKIEQAFDTAGKTTGELKPSTKYTLAARVRASSGVVAGALQFAVKDGSNNILDSSNAQIDVDLTATSTGAFDFVSAEFITPASLPTGTKFVIELNTAITSGKECYIDDVCLFPMTQFGGPGGPFINIITGSTAFVARDRFLMTAANAHAGEFQFYLDRLWGLYAMGLILPYNTAGGETISDTLIS